MLEGDMIINSLFYRKVLFIVKYNDLIEPKRNCHEKVNEFNYCHTFKWNNY